MALRKIETTARQMLGNIAQSTPTPTAPSPSRSTSENGDCPICRGIGYYRVDVPVGHPQFGKLIPCGCKTQERIAHLQRLSGLTESERAIRLDDIAVQNRPGTAAMVEAVRQFIGNPSGILTLWGGPGNAKSMALCAAVNALVAQGIPAVYITAFDLISHIREAFNKGQTVVDESAYNRLMRFERVRVLAIDEFDKIRMTEWATEQITDLIDRRYRLGIEGKAGTLIAMNSDPAAQPIWIASRLLDGRNAVVRNDDTDIRPLLR